MAPSPLWTLAEVAEYLRLTPASLYTQRARNENPGSLGFKVGRKIVFRQTDLVAYLDTLAPGIDR
jgi:hypothetical protein